MNTPDTRCTNPKCTNKRCVGCIAFAPSDTPDTEWEKIVDRWISDAEIRDQHGGTGKETAKIIASDVLTLLSSQRASCVWESKDEEELMFKDDGYRITAYRNGEEIGTVTEYKYSEQGHLYKSFIHALLTSRDTYWQQHERDMYESLDKEYQLQIEHAEKKRDTYWKERVRKEVEYSRDWICSRGSHPQEYSSHLNTVSVSLVEKTFKKLDTLLDNLK